jgi:TrmH family RNA methyltransferase
MLTTEELAQVCVVLVRARNPVNIGAAARAMHDFGFGRLRVVNQYPPPLEMARSAVDASEVIAHAVAFPNVAEAVADCTLVVGTTEVGERDLQHELLALSEAAVRMRAELRRGDGWTGRVAVLFGSEKTGLSNQELSHCDWLLTVPMHEHAGLRHASMNLGQAVAVCLYELVRDAPNDHLLDAPKAAEPAHAAGLERLTILLGEVLEQTEYARRHPANRDSEAHVRRLVRRMRLDAADLTVWMGILRQVLWKLGGNDEK